MPQAVMLTCMAPAQETNTTVTIGDHLSRLATHLKPIIESAAAKTAVSAEVRVLEMSYSKYGLGCCLSLT